MRLIWSPLEDDGDGVAAHGLLQLLCQGGEMTRLQRGEEASHEQSEERGKLKRLGGKIRLNVITSQNTEVIRIS